MRFPSTVSSLLAFIAITIAMAGQSLATDYQAGVRQITVPSQGRDIDINVTIWYPASPGGEAVSLGENIFFEGTEAFMGAPVSDGQHPLILLSHGAGLSGRAEAMSWIAAPLAASGYIVAAPTHPGNTGPDRSAAETMKLWLRPADLSATLDAIEKDATLSAHIHPRKRGVLGLSMGGNTALLMAGARLDPDLWANYCDTNERNPSLCGWVRGSGVDLHAMDHDAAGRDNSDDRIRFALAIDPAPADMFALESLAEVQIPVTLVNLGKEVDIPATVRGSSIAGAIPGAGYKMVEEADHASMFALCKPGAAEIAVEEGIEDKICTGPDEQARSVTHARLIEIVTTALDQAFDSEE